MLPTGLTDITGRLRRSLAFRTRRRALQLKRFLQNRWARVNERPIFVLGNQKSGTTAIAGLVAEYAGMFVEQQGTPWGNPSLLDIVQEEYASKTATLDFAPSSASDFTAVYRGDTALNDFINSHRRLFSRDLIKVPNLTFALPLLRQRFPKAQWVMIVRDPRDNIRSICDRLHLPGDAADDEPLRRMKGTPGWRRIVSNEGLSLPGGTYIERLARRWRCAIDLYQEFAADMHLVCYEDFCADKEACIASLAERLGLRRHQRIADFVDHPYQPRGDNRGTSPRDFFGDENLECIEDICTPKMEAVGYERSTAMQRESENTPRTSTS